MGRHRSWKSRTERMSVRDHPTWGWFDSPDSTTQRAIRWFINREKILHRVNIPNKEPQLSLGSMFSRFVISINKSQIESKLCIKINPLSCIIGLSCIWGTMPGLIPAIWPIIWDIIGFIIMAKNHYVREVTQGRFQITTYKSPPKCQPGFHFSVKLTWPITKFRHFSLLIYDSNQD